MNRLHAWFRKLTGVVPTQQQEQEFSSELESHLQLHIDDNLRAGMTPADARRSAIIKLGGIEHTKQAHRETRTFPLIETTFQDGFDRESLWTGGLQSAGAPQASQDRTPGARDVQLPV